MTITDQELADAIRARFKRVMTGLAADDLALFGSSVLSFCDEHPVWEPRSDALAYSKTHERDVWVVGLNPTNKEEWVIQYRGNLLYAPGTDLTAPVGRR